MSNKERRDRRLPRVGARDRRDRAARARSGAQDLDRAARLRRARLHDAAAARGSLPDDAQRSATASSRCCSAGAPPKRSRSARSRPARRTICSAPPTSRARWSPSSGMSDELGAINYDGNKRAALPRHRRCRRSAACTARRRRRRSTPRSSASSPMRTTRRGGSSPITATSSKSVTHRLLEVEVMEGDELRRCSASKPSPRSAAAASHRASLIAAVRQPTI